MAFFGGSMFGDPYGDPRSMMQRHMQEMNGLMESMMADPFGDMFGPSFGSPRHMMIDSPRHVMIDDGHRHRLHQPQMPGFGMDMMPFGGGLLGGMFGRMGNVFQQFENMHNTAMADPQGQVYSHSQVISVNNLGDAPQVYEESNTTRKVGQAAETRRTVRDSTSGLEQMSIGHKLGDREHVIRKSRMNGGDIEEEQDFVNLKHDHAQSFDREFSQATQQAYRPNRLHPGRHRHRDHGMLSLEDSDSPREDRASPYHRRQERPHGHRGPIIEEVE